MHRNLRVVVFIMHSVSCESNVIFPFPASGVDKVRERGAPLPGNDKENWGNHHVGENRIFEDKHGQDNNLQTVQPPDNI